MKLIAKKLLDTDSSTIYLFFYWLIIQVIAMPVIYYYCQAYQDAGPLLEKLMLIWFFLPVVTVLFIIVAVLQIRQRKHSRATNRFPLIGLILNSAWLVGYALLLSMIFA